MFLNVAYYRKPILEDENVHGIEFIKQHNIPMFKG